ncbi:MAG: hypothetical protein CUN56_11225 [Phototrophicales bacterium]|nr:MAG: hypothetical protein CUN56_11225 [Phototrophicales bacterium]RMG72021.1 MAG: DUF983 domain-containing protein [Chloroflexota bacterium]
MRWKRAIRKIYVGAIQRRCPECERGGLFVNHFQMRATCAYCDARFFRDPGDAMGAVFINVVISELSALAGFFFVHQAIHPPMILQLLFWIPYVLLFSLWFYPIARGMWVAILYLTGGVYADLDYEREYITSYELLEEEEIGDSSIDIP